MNKILLYNLHMDHQWLSTLNAFITHEISNPTLTFSPPPPPFLPTHAHTSWNSVFCVLTNIGLGLERGQVQTEVLLHLCKLPGLEGRCCGDLRQRLHHQISKHATQAVRVQMQATYQQGKCLTCKPSFLNTVFMRSSKIQPVAMEQKSQHIEAVN